MKKAVFYLSFCLIVLCLSCSTNYVRKAENLQKGKYYDEALQYYLLALKSDPDNVELKISLDRLLKEGSRYYFYLGKEGIAEGRLKDAEFALRRSLEFDPGNNEARSALSEITDQKKEMKGIDRLKEEMAINVGLPEVFRDEHPIDLKFTNKVELTKIFLALAKSGGVNIQFDPNFRDRKADISLVDINFHEALERLCLIFRCRYFVLDNRNIVVSSDDRESVKPYEKLIARNIFFSNIDVEEARRMIEGIIRAERLTVNKQTNGMLVVDAVENIVLIEKLAEFIDKRRGEVEIEVEIMEVDQNKLEEYGLQFSAYQVSAKLDKGEEGKRLNDFYYLSADDFIFSVPRMVWKFSSLLTDSQILARPRVRGLDEEKIEIKLGEKVPIPRTTFVPISGGGLNEQPITSYDLQDVGITINIVPKIHHNREMTLELRFELTYVTDPGTAFVPPTLGNRFVSTKLRLLDSETGIIAGLMRGSSKSGSQGIPIINSIPILRDIFSSRNKKRERTDIIISITPHIIRMPEITRGDLEAYLIGTRDQVRLEKWKNYKGEKEKVK